MTTPLPADAGRQAAHPSFAALQARLRAGPLTRLVAFGSSNTERASHTMGAHNWFDWLDVGLQVTYGRVHHCINAGICGETSRHLLARFDRDVAFYQPHAVLITIGGNDSAPGHAMEEQEFRANLVELVRRVRSLPQALPILQTYYSFDLERIQPAHAARFTRDMEVVREVAAATGTALVDNLARWEVLRVQEPHAFRALMRDTMHVNPLGNLLWGLDLCRLFGAPISPIRVPEVAAGCTLQQHVDQRVAASGAA